LGLTVASDFITDKNWPALNKGKGDAFMILGATLYGFSQFYSTLFAHSSRGLTIRYRSECHGRVFRQEVTALRGNWSCRIFLNNIL
jgi:hypothetical protein